MSERNFERVALELLARHQFADGLLVSVCGLEEGMVPEEFACGGSPRRMALHHLVEQVAKGGIERVVRERRGRARLEPVRAFVLQVPRLERFPKSVVVADAVLVALLRVDGVEDGGEPRRLDPAREGPLVIPKQARAGKGEHARELDPHNAGGPHVRFAAVVIRNLLRVQVDVRGTLHAHDVVEQVDRHLRLRSLVHEPFRRRVNRGEGAAKVHHLEQI
mmetsp:Transcript_4397/g.15268  ORF Transcript_4397/g.15268 Transcript_4397/m.15268 type:complete len:219 (-) Transcript_4397:1327-1983(-)